MIGWARSSLRARRQERAEAFFKGLLDDHVHLSEGECRSAFESESLCTELILRLLEDEEDEKTWAYTLLFRAFAYDVVPRENRLRFLRTVRELTHADLRSLRSWTDSRRRFSNGPRVVAEVRVGSDAREWTLFPEQLEEENPNMFDVFCRWGFLVRRHQRAPLQKGQHSISPPDLHPETFPVPGQSHLEVQPVIGELLYILVPWRDDGKTRLEALSELAVTEIGKHDSRSFRAVRREHRRIETRGTGGGAAVRPVDPGS